MGSTGHPGIDFTGVPQGRCALKGGPHRVPHSPRQDNPTSSPPAADATVTSWGPRSAPHWGDVRFPVCSWVTARGPCLTPHSLQQWPCHSGLYPFCPPAPGGGRQVCAMNEPDTHRHTWLTCPKRHRHRMAGTVGKEGAEVSETPGALSHQSEGAEKAAQSRRDRKKSM